MGNGANAMVTYINAFIPKLKQLILFHDSYTNRILLLQRMKMRKWGRLRVNCLNPRRVWRRMPKTTRINLTFLSISAKTAQESFTDKKDWKSTNL